MQSHSKRPLNELDTRSGDNGMGYAPQELNEHEEYIQRQELGPETHASRNELPGLEPAQELSGCRSPGSMSRDPTFELAT